MMKKIILITMLLLMSSLAFAGNNYEFSFVNENNDPVTGLDYEFYDCTNTDNICDEVLSNYNVVGNTESSDTIYYEARGTTSSNNYAFYVFEDGYLPFKGHIAGDSGTGLTGYDNYVLEKKALCIAPIVNFSVVNEAEAYKPINVAVNTSLSADTASAFEFVNNFPNYKPNSIYTTHRDLFEATTEMTVKVYHAGALVETLTDVKNIFADEIGSFNFTYVPTRTGAYTFEFNSEVIDTQCVASEITIATDYTTVVASNDTLYSYSNLKELRYLPVHPLQGESLQANVDYLSNFVELDGSLVKTPTLITFTLREGKNAPNGIILDAQTSTYVDSTNETFGTASFSSTLNQPGWYTLVANATPVKAGDKLTREVFVTFKVEGIADNLFDQLIYVRDINGSRLFNVTGELDIGTVNASVDNVITFSNLGLGTYTYNLTKPGYENYVSTFTIDNGNDYLTAYMTKIPDVPPVVLTYNETILIFDATTREPILGVESVIDTADIKYSDVYGIVMHTELKSGMYSFVLNKAGYETYSSEFTLSNSNGQTEVYMVPTNIPPVENIHFNFSLDVQNSNGVSLDDVELVFENTQAKYTVDGNVEVLNLVAGTYAYTLSKSGYLSFSGIVTIIDSNVSQLIVMKTLESAKAPSANTGSTSTLINIDFDAIDHADATELEYVMLSFKNSGSESVENIIVTISIPELGTWDKAGPFDLKSGSKVNRQMSFDVPDYEAGWYNIRVQVDGQGYNRARWYEVYLE